MRRSTSAIWAAVTDGTCCAAPGIRPGFEAGRAESPFNSTPPASCADRMSFPGRAGDDALRPSCKIAEAAQGGTPHHVAQEENSGIEVEHDRIDDGQDQEPHHKEDDDAINDTAPDFLAARGQARSDHEGEDQPKDDRVHHVT